MKSTINLASSGHSVPIEFVPEVALTPVELAVQRKLTMAGENAELTLEEFAAWRGRSVRSVRRDLPKTPGVCRTGPNQQGIHLGTYLEVNRRKRAGGV